MVVFFSSRRRHTRWPRDWSSDVCSSDLVPGGEGDIGDPTGLQLPGGGGGEVEMDADAADRGPVGVDSDWLPHLTVLFADLLVLQVGVRADTYPRTRGHLDGDLGALRGVGLQGLLHDLRTILRAARVACQQQLVALDGQLLE